MSFDLTGGNDEQIAAELREDNITVYAIHISDSDGARPDRQRSPAAPAARSSTRATRKG